MWDNGYYRTNLLGRSSAWVPTSNNRSLLFEKLALSARRATRRQTLRSFGDVAWGFLLDQKHGRIDHAYCPNDFRQGRARASKEGRTELERELRAVDDSTPWLSFGETAEVE